MNRKLLGVLVLSVVVLAGATTFAFSSVEVIVESGQVDAVGKVTTINLTLSEAPNGLSGYNITVSLSNGSVAEIISVDFPAWATLKDNSTLPADAFWLKAADLMDQIKSNATDIVLATLTIRGDEIGNTDIFTDINRMDDDNGNPIYPSITNGLINVIRPTPTSTPTPTYRRAPGGGVTADSDGDGYSDSYEIRMGTDPHDPKSYPGAPTPKVTPSPSPSLSPTPTPTPTPILTPTPPLPGRRHHRALRLYSLLHVCSQSHIWCCVGGSEGGTQVNKKLKV